MADDIATNPEDLTLRALATEARSLLVAYPAGAGDTRTVDQWADGTRCPPSSGAVARLQLALTAARVITTRDSPTVTQAWFLGRNPTLGDRSPAE